MISFPNGKINLGLYVVQKRPDGYHDIETVFYPVAIRDALEIVTSDTFICKLTGLPVEGSFANNLCTKAYYLLKKDFPDLPAVNVHLHKAIPMGAGLGGGSADGAFMLAMLNKKFHLQLNEKKLLQYSLELGSDCPFFIINKPCYATGRGENLSQLDINLEDYKIAVINPGIHVSTKEAFSTLKPQIPKKGILDIVKQPILTWKDELKNDFEDTVFAIHPTIKEIKKRLYNMGAVYAAMSGSGSSVFGIFHHTTKTTFSFPAHYNCFTIP